MKTRGFTLIELLVVVLILAILFMIVYVSIGDSRDTGDELTLKSSMSNSTAQATLYFERKGTYLGVCEDHEFGVEGTYGTVKEISSASLCNGNNSGYIMSARLEDNNFWCVDSRGFLGSVGPNPYFPGGIAGNPSSGTVGADRCLVSASSVPSWFKGPATNTY